MPHHKLLQYFYTFFLFVIGLYICLDLVYFVSESVLALPPNGNFSANIFWVVDILGHVFFISLIIHFVRLNERYIYIFLSLNYLVNLAYLNYIYDFREMPTKELADILIFMEKIIFWMVVLSSLAFIYSDSAKRGSLTYYGLFIFASKLIWWLFPGPATFTYEIGIIILDVTELIIIGLYFWYYIQDKKLFLFRHEEDANN